MTRRPGEELMTDFFGTSRKQWTHAEMAQLAEAVALGLVEFMRKFRKHP